MKALAGAGAFAAALVIFPKLLRKPFERIQQLWRAARELKKGHFGTARYATNTDIKKTDLYKPGGIVLHTAFDYCLTGP